MIDSTKQKPIRVKVDEATGPYILLPASQISTVGKVLEENDISYWVDDIIVSVDGQPAQGAVYIHRDADPVKVQALLDAAA